ncbi:uncharacterized protein PFL1_05559 [Pseudozyma flocculosa PF-1]|uniref:Mediator of RNA polymerase II transcription subunit 8 n=2 Tax=Pseudozyma flocculosa TaxID=84751 RepID=A0A5C3F9P9_9BASI|nr:uncharacterized protein PFL1_05559 [Pseudozyma flocculosa PF-1]EPQ26924.1 hypothetical protein PFL1_05559 [Pseudozyma flocculosa PF-1]SPO41168.1 uncharacterized protein PSFLO_06650 [Pseudozyma flocculosa]
MATAKRNAVAPPPGPPTMPRVQPPIDHLQILLQRFESLISSIVTLREETQMIPGIDEWPSLLNRYSNLLSHAYSINASLLSASPHFLSSQLIAFNKVLEAEARSANLYAGVEESTSALFGGLLGGRSGAAGGVEGDDDVKATADGLPELSYRDAKNQLPSLVAHPLLPIAEENLNFLGALLRTAPEPQILEQELQLVREYDEQAAEKQRLEAEANPGVPSLSEAEQLDEDIAQHDVLALRALRMWYHIQQAPDEDGNVFNPRDRLPREEDELENEEDEDDDDGDEEMGVGGATAAGQAEDTPAERRRRLQRRKEAERNTWTADSVAAFLHGKLPATQP